jgi:hypothetical protein
VIARKKRLLHVFATFAVGGPQVRATQLMNVWGDQFEHGIVASDGRYDALDLIDPKIAAAVVQDYPPMKGAGLWRTLRDTGMYLKNSQWDLLVTYNWGAMESALANRLFGKIPHVHHEEGFGPDEPLGHNPKRALFRRLALGGAQALIVPSAVMVGVAKNKWGFSPPRVHACACFRCLQALGEKAWRYLDRLCVWLAARKKCGPTGPCGGTGFAAAEKCICRDLRHWGASRGHSRRSGKIWCDRSGASDGVSGATAPLHGPV